MKIETKLLLERAMGIVEGIAYSLGDKNTAEGLFNAVEIIDSTINVESEVQGE